MGPYINTLTQTKDRSAEILTDPVTRGVTARSTETLGRVERGVRL